MRAWRQERELRTVEQQLQESSEHFASIDAAVASIPVTVDGFGGRIAYLDKEIGRIQRKIVLAMSRHETYLNNVMVAEMQEQRSRIQVYRAQARFALASIYDRMSAQNQER